LPPLSAAAVSGLCPGHSGVSLFFFLGIWCPPDPCDGLVRVARVRAPRALKRCAASRVVGGCVCRSPRPAAVAVVRGWEGRAAPPRAAPAAAVGPLGARRRTPPPTPTGSSSLSPRRCPRCVFAPPPRRVPRCRAFAWPVAVAGRPPRPPPTGGVGWSRTRWGYGARAPRLCQGPCRRRPGRVELVGEGGSGRRLSIHAGRGDATGSDRAPAATPRVTRASTSCGCARQSL